MADSVKSLRSEYEELVKTCGTLIDGMGEKGKVISKTNAVLKDTMANLRERIQELKNEGAIGKSIKDFVADKDVRMMYAVATGYADSAKQNAGKASDNEKAAVKKVMDKYKSLKERIAALIKAAEKDAKKNTKNAGVSEAEFKDLLKLQGEVAKLETEKRGVKRLATFDPDVGEDDKLSLDDRLKKMIADIKPDKSKARKKMVKDYDTRSIKQMQKDFVQLVRESENTREEAGFAGQKGEAEKLKLAIKTLDEQLEDLEEIRTLCKKSKDDAKLRTSIQEAPDGVANLKILDELLKRVDAPITANTKAKKTKLA